MYQKETQLVKTIETHMQCNQTPFSELHLAFEFPHTNGRADIIGKNNKKKLFAFEAKLSNWKKALTQAYRNSSYAHYSYVILPSDQVKNVMKHKTEFIRRRVGLCSVSQNKITIKIKAKKNQPLKPWLTKNALERISEE